MKKIQLYFKPERYENIFNVYEHDGEVPYTYYDILTKVSIPSDIDPDYLNKFTIPSEMPWTTISYNIYGTQHLWWLLCLLNNIKNPVKLLEAGSEIIALKEIYLSDIYSTLKTKI